MGKLVDLSGQRFSRWTVLSKSSHETSKATSAFWLCRCDCGTGRVVSGRDLRYGRTRSCGCLALELSVARETTHGRTGTPEHDTWNAMRARCDRPTHSRYRDYGGRGIKVCARWEESFGNFFRDMGPKPSPGHSIDRINNEGDYEPSNCRWATAKQQRSNQRQLAGVRPKEESNAA